jgi:hypothetical protein
MISETELLGLRETERRLLEKQGQLQKEVRLQEEQAREVPETDRRLQSLRQIVAEEKQRFRTEATALRQQIAKAKEAAPPPDRRLFPFALDSAIDSMFSMRRSSDESRLNTSKEKLAKLVERAGKGEAIGPDCRRRPSRRGA